MVSGRVIPGDFAAILSGHIHRYQCLDRTLDDGTFGAPVLYPGSVERTSIAEKDERKGYLLIEAIADGSGRGRMTGHQFVELPARPMVTIEMEGVGLNRSRFLSLLKKQIALLDPESVVRLRFSGKVDAELMGLLGASSLRSLAPSTMNLEIRWANPRGS